MATELTLQEDMASFSYSSADSSGNTFDNASGQVYLHVKNDHTSPLTVTIHEQRTCSFGHAATNVTESISNGSAKILGPFDLQRFNDTKRKVNLTFPSGVTSLSIAAVKA